MTVKPANLWVLLISITLSQTSYAVCPCFHRHSLYSLFYSEDELPPSQVKCALISDGYHNPDHSIATIASLYRGRGSQTSNYGQVRSHLDRCELLIDNQVINQTYTEYQQKYHCDREIIRACEALNSPNKQWPRGDQPFEQIKEW